MKTAIPKAPAHYFALRSACLPLIEAYHVDLLKSDRRLIRQFPSVPFIHVTRDYGTYCEIMPPADCYPAEGVKIPYLFGTADRWHIINQRGQFVRYCHQHHPTALVHHFDGTELHVISYAEAFEILRSYIHKIRCAFAEDIRQKMMAGRLAA